MGCWAGSQPPVPKQEGGLQYWARYVTNCKVSLVPGFIFRLRKSQQRLHARPCPAPPCACVRAKLLQSCPDSMTL